MVLQNKIKTIFVIAMFFAFTIGTQSTSAVEVWTAHVKWQGYDFSSDIDCGDGAFARCENRMEVKRTTSSSCTSRTWSFGLIKYNYPGYSSQSGFYELTWSKTYGPPCLTFDVRVYETSAGSATSIYTFTINSNGQPSSQYLNLILGTANGDFTIEYWVTATD